MSRRSLASIAVGALAATVLSGCATGLNPGTYQQKGRQDSAAAELDPLVVRNLHVQGPATGVIPSGGNAILTGSFINRGTTPDRLRDVSSELATSVTLTIDEQPVTGVEVPAGGAVETWTAVLSGLTREVRAGEYIPVTLTFATSGRTTLSVPVQTGDNGLVGRETAQDPYAEHGHPRDKGKGGNDEPHGEADVTEPHGEEPHG